MLTERGSQIENTTYNTGFPAAATSGPPYFFPLFTPTTIGPAVALDSIRHSPHPRYPPSIGANIHNISEGAFGHGDVATGHPAVASCL